MSNPFAPTTMIQFLLANQQAEEKRRQQEAEQKQAENRKFIDMLVQLPADARTPELFNQLRQRTQDPGIAMILEAQTKHEKKQAQQERLGTSQETVAQQITDPLVTPERGAGALSRDEVLARLNTIRSLGEQQGLSRRESERSLQSVDLARGRALGAEQASSIEQAKQLRKERFSDSNVLRDEFTKLSGEFISQRNAFDRVLASAKDPTPEGDFALIFNFMKVLDPDSVVREGEFANATNAPGVPAALRTRYNRLVGNPEGTLPKHVRDSFVDRSRKLYERGRKRQRALEKEFRNLSSRNDLDPKDVIIDFAGNLSGPAAELAPPRDEQGAMPIGMTR